MKQIIFATGNAGKMKEIREILNGTGWNVLSLKDAGIDADIEENGTTFEENAKIKAEGIRNWCLKNGIPGCSDLSAEKIIVYGNRYRSTYEEIDIALTKAEELFKRGKYKESLELSKKSLSFVDKNIE